jgi:hypothetical protein
MATRQVYANSATARATTTSTTYGDLVALTFTPDASAVYAIVWGCVTDMGSTNNNVLVRLFHDTDAVILAEYGFRPRDLIDNCSNGGVAFYTAPASPAEQTFSIEFRSGSAATAGAEQGYLLAIKLGANDQIASAAGDTSTTSSTPQDKTTLTWTPVAGDYLVIASGSLGGSTAVNSYASARLFDETTAYGSCEGVGRSATTSAGTRPFWGTVVALTLSAISTTLKTQFWSRDNTSTALFRESYILALNLDDWPDAWTASSRTRETTTSSTAQAKASLTQTTLLFPHIILGCGVLDHDATNTSCYGQLDEDGTIVGVEDEYEPYTTTTSFMPFFRVVHETPTAASHTWRTLYRSETSNTTGFAESAIALLQIEEAAGAKSFLYPPTTPAMMSLLVR